MEIHKKENMMNNDVFVCQYCDAKFCLKRTLANHLKNGKKCISKRPKEQINCIWCNITFVTKEERDKHYKKCSRDKEHIHILLLEKMKDKDKLIEEKDKQIKDLQDKLFSLANKPTTSTTTVNTLNNVKLSCGKPLDFTVKSLLAKMKKTLTIDHILLGKKGLVKWLLEYGCVNTQGIISIQTTDKNRQSMRYIDLNETSKQISGSAFKVTVDKALRLFKKTKEYGKIQDTINDDCIRTSNWSKKIDHDEFFNVESGFIRSIISQTFIHYPSNSINQDVTCDEDIDTDEEDEEDSVKIEVINEKEKRLQEAYAKKPTKIILRNKDIFYDDTPYNSD